jgi:hypothetical protein
MGDQQIMSDERPDLARQALGRPLSETEQSLAAALFAIFATGTHDFEDVAAELTARGVVQPSGGTAAWTVALLEQELSVVNASLDASYAAGGGVPKG